MFYIIIPTYNRKKTLKRTIDSIINQKWNFNYKIYIIDDGSKDGTKNFIKDTYKDLKCLNYFYKNNWWVSSARNFWIKKVLSDSNKLNDFILFLDSDDELLNDALLKINKIINDYDFIKYFAFWVINNIWKNTFKNLNDNQILNYIDVIKWEKAYWEFFRVLNVEILKKWNYLFPENINWGEDILWLNISKKYKLLVSNYIVRKYYQDWIWITRDFLDRKKINNFLLYNKMLISLYNNDFLKYNKKQLWIYYLVYSRMLALHWYRTKSFKFWILGFFYSLDFKRFILYLFSLLPFWIKINNFLLIIKK